MEINYDANKKNCCECKCGDCFEDEVIEIKTSRMTRLFAAAILLSSLTFVVFAILYILGG